MRKLLLTLFFFLLTIQICFAQWKDETTIPKQINDILPMKPHNPTHTSKRSCVIASFFLRSKS